MTSFDGPRIAANIKLRGGVSFSFGVPAGRRASFWGRSVPVGLGAGSMANPWMLHGMDGPGPVTVAVFCGVARVTEDAFGSAGFLLPAPIMDRDGILPWSSAGDTALFALISNRVEI